MGGMDTLLEQARASYEGGDHRWVAEVLRHAVFADPTCEEARLLQADAFEQLAYRAESGPWRDIYLTGAQELRNGSFDVPAMQRPRPEIARGMTLQQVFDYLAVRVDGPPAADLGHLTINWQLPDTDEVVRVELSNGTLHSTPGRSHLSPDAVVTCDRTALNELVATGGHLADLGGSGAATVSGDTDRVLALWDTLTDFPIFFRIIEP